MEKIMRLVSVSDLQSRSYTDRQGQSQVIESYELRFDDGVLSIIGETSLCQFLNTTYEDSAFRYAFKIFNENNKRINKASDEEKKLRTNHVSFH